MQTDKWTDVKLAGISGIMSCKYIEKLNHFTFESEMRNIFVNLSTLGNHLNHAAKSTP